MSVQETLQTLLSEFKHTVKSETVFGDPFQAGTTTIIPVSKISFGFTAAGSAKNGGANGTGGGGQVTPVALISVKEDGDIKVHPIGRERGDSLADKLLDLAPDVVEQVTKAVRKAKK